MGCALSAENDDGNVNINISMTQTKSQICWAPNGSEGLCGENLGRIQTRNGAVEDDIVEVIGDWYSIGQDAYYGLSKNYTREIKVDFYTPTYLLSLLTIVIIVVVPIFSLHTF